MLKRILLFAALAAILVSGCSKGVGNQPYGEIQGKVQLSQVDAVPPYPLDVTLLRLSNSRFDSIASQVTQANGSFVFTHLDTGQYLVRPDSDVNYGETISNWATVTSQNPSVNVNVAVLPYHYLYPDTLTFPVDTTMLGTSWSSGLLNIGTRDTLFCQFDLSQLPGWLYFKISQNVFPPSKVFTYDPNVTAGVEKSTLPASPWPKVMKIPYTTQFQSHTLYIELTLKSQ